MEHGEAANVEEAVNLGQGLLENGIIHHSELHPTLLLPAGC